MRSATSLLHSIFSGPEASASFPQNSSQDSPSALPAPGFEAPGVTVHVVETPTEGPEATPNPGPQISDRRVDLERRKLTVALRRDPFVNAEGRALFIQFCETHIGVRSGDLTGFQQGFGKTPDQLLFRGPANTTLCVPVSLLLERRDIARQTVREKIQQATKKFTKQELQEWGDRLGARR